MEMNPEQVQLLLALLDKIATGISATKPYTLTGASDWPLLVILVGLFGAVITGLIAFMWRDLRGIVGEQKNESKFDRVEIGVLKDRMQRQETRCEMQIGLCPIPDRRNHPLGRREEDGGEDGGHF